MADLYLDLEELNAITNTRKVIICEISRETDTEANKVADPSPTGLYNPV